MLNIIMFKNLGFERLRITSPRLYHTKVKQNNFKKTGGYDPPPPPPPRGGWHGSCREQLPCQPVDSRPSKKSEKKSR